MPFSINNFMGGTISGAQSSNIISTVFGSPIYVAIIIMLMIVLIMTIVFDEDASFIKNIFKIFIYGLFASVAIIFLHDTILRGRLETKHQNSTESLNPVKYNPMNQYVPGNVQITPMMYNQSSTVPQPMPQNQPMSQTQPMMQPQPMSQNQPMM